jgi:hypothetical protein
VILRERHYTVPFFTDTSAYFPGRGRAKCCGVRTAGVLYRVTYWFLSSNRQVTGPDDTD